MRLLLCLTLLSLAACTLTDESTPIVESSSLDTQMAPYTVDQYVSSLTVGLSQIQGSFKSNARIAITSFYMADALSTELATAQGTGLSQQIQESLITQFTQLGYKTIEYRLQHGLNLSANADAVLTRDIDNLQQRQNIDFVITGTLTRQQHAYIVNARLVNIQNQQIVSAASTEIPINAMWGNEKIQQRDGMLYRSEY